MEVQPDIQTTESGWSFFNWFKRLKLDGSVAIFDINWTVHFGLDLGFDGKVLGWSVTDRPWPHQQSLVLNWMMIVHKRLFINVIMNDWEPLGFEQADK